MNINSITQSLLEFRKSEIKCSQQSIVIAMLFQNDVVSTVDMRDAGVMTPLQIIGSLIKKGAIITKERRNATDRSDRLYRRVNHFSLIGWENNE